MEKYYRAGQATDDNMAHAHCMLDTKGCKRPHKTCNACCFFTATVVGRTRLNITLYVHCLSCSFCVLNFMSACRPDFAQVARTR